LLGCIGFFLMANVAEPGERTDDCGQWIGNSPPAAAIIALV
jgi:hypothetical protein